MAESNENEKHATKTVTDEPQEEFIAPEAVPSHPENPEPDERQN